MSKNWGKCWHQTFQSKGLKFIEILWGNEHKRNSMYHLTVEKTVNSCLLLIFIFRNEIQ